MKNKTFAVIINTHDSIDSYYIKGVTFERALKKEFQSLDDMIFGCCKIDEFDNDFNKFLNWLRAGEGFTRDFGIKIDEVK